MSSWLECLGWLVLFFLNASLASIQAESSNRDGTQIVFKNDVKFVGQRIQKFLQEKSVPAISLAVTKDDRLVYAESFGYANVSSCTSVTPEYRFRVASVSKTMAAVAVMDLIAKGYLDLSSKVLGDGSILGHDFGDKPYSDKEKAITVQHLLEHSSGFDDGTMGGDPTYQEQWLWRSHDELIATVLDTYDPSAWPGTNASYSNFGYMMVGRIVEKITGKDYSTYSHQNIFNLVGARKMEIASDKPKQQEVVYYDKNKTAPYTFHISRRDSVGAWIARPIDLVAVLTSIDGRHERLELLPTEVEALMYEKSDIKNSTYAKGWDEVTFGEDGKLIEANKNGGFPGTTAWISVRAKENVTYAVAANTAIDSAADLKSLIDAIMEDVDTWPGIDLFPDYGIKQRNNEKR